MTNTKRAVPGLQAELEMVEILSARAGFEASFPGDSHAWKMHAFLQASPHNLPIFIPVYLHIYLRRCRTSCSSRR
jgi:hypothetical protein